MRIKQVDYEIVWIGKEPNPPMSVIIDLVNLDIKRMQKENERRKKYGPEMQDWDL